MSLEQLYREDGARHRETCQDPVPLCSGDCTAPLYKPPSLYRGQDTDVGEDEQDTDVGDDKQDTDVGDDKQDTDVGDDEQDTGVGEAEQDTEDGEEALGDVVIEQQAALEARNADEIVKVVVMEKTEADRSVLCDHDYFVQPDMSQFNEHSYGAMPKNDTNFRPFNGRGGLFKLDQQAAERKSVFNSKMKKINLTDFECRNCSEVCEGEEKAHKHCNRKHCPDMNSGEVKCQICKEVFSSLVKYKLHKVKKHGKLIKCRLCGVICQGRANLVTHTRQKHGKLDECSVCGKSFKNRYNWLQHVKRHRGLLKKYSCPHCNVKSEKRSDISRHISRKHKTIQETTGQDGAIEDRDYEEMDHEDGHKRDRYEEDGNQDDQDKAIRDQNKRGAEDLIQTPRIAKRRKIQVVICPSGEEETDERILHVSGRMVSQLRLPYSATDDNGKRSKVIEVGNGIMDFEVMSATGIDNTAVLAGNEYVSTMKFSTSGVNITTTNVLDGSPIIQTELVWIEKKLHWLVGTSNRLQMFSLEDKELALVTTINISDLVSFTVDSAGDQVFLLQNSGGVTSAKLSTREATISSDSLVQGQAVEGSYCSIFFCISQDLLYLVSKESHDIYRGTFKEGVLMDVMKKVYFITCCFNLGLHIICSYNNASDISVRSVRIKLKPSKCTMSIKLLITIILKGDIWEAIGIPHEEVLTVMGN